MSSLKSLAATIRREKPFFFYSDHDRTAFEAAVLEIAHAISRGRKPSSCSVLPGQNIQAWLRRTFIEIHPNCSDYTGKDCSIANDRRDVLCWCYDDPEAQTIVRAISVCYRYIRPIKKPKEYHGDYEYQNAHPVTNLKRKIAWQRRAQGSYYDDMDGWADWGDFDLECSIRGIASN